MKKEEQDRLYQEFKKLYQKGTKEDLNKFLKNNFKKLSENTKNKIILFLLVKRLTNTSKDNQEIIDLGKEGLKTLNNLSSFKKSLKDELKIMNIKEKLK